MWDIPIKSAGLIMHHNDYIDHDTIINYRKPSLSGSQKEKNSAPSPLILFGEHSVVHLMACLSYWRKRGIMML